jgi:hypothetical protein
VRVELLLRSNVRAREQVRSAFDIQIIEAECLSSKDVVKEAKALLRRQLVVVCGSKVVVDKLVQGLIHLAGAFGFGLTETHANVVRGTAFDNL